MRMPIKNGLRASTRRRAVEKGGTHSAWLLTRVWLLIPFLVLLARGEFSAGSPPEVLPQERSEAGTGEPKASGGQEEAEPAKPETAPKKAATEPPQDSPSATPSPELAPGIVARVNGRDISVEEYASYLFATVGKSKLDEYVDRLLIEEEAVRLGITVTPEQVEAALEERIDRTVKSLYQGQQQLFLANLARRRTTLNEYKARWRQRMYFDMLLEAVVLRTRKVTPEALAKEFTRSYGEGGVQHVLRHIMVSKRLRTKEGLVRSDSEAKARASQVLKELQAGLDFGQAVKQYSDDTFTKRNEGRIVHYRKGFYGTEFHDAVGKLTTEARRSGVVASPRGYHIVELIKRRTTRFDEVKVELEAFYKSKPATIQEKHAVSERLRKSAKIVGLD